MSEQDERRERGKEILASIHGSDDPDSELEAFLARHKDGLGELIVDFGLGEVWSRPYLDRRERSLIVIAALIASGRTDPLARHIKGALNHGATPEQIREVIIQLAVYVGFPSAVQAMPVATRVFEELGLGT
jgi:alkylhydroperoxidase/carboxymuconolactone decarboxylase family protein YurZ